MSFGDDTLCPTNAWIPQRRAADAGRIQQMPTHSAESVDVLRSLQGVVPPDIYEKLEERVAVGVKKYGTRLETFNGRDCLLDCEQEALDGIMYGQQAVLQGISKGYLRDRFVQIIREIEQLRKP